MREDLKKLKKDIITAGEVAVKELIKVLITPPVLHRLRRRRHRRPVPPGCRHRRRHSCRPGPPG